MDVFTYRQRGRQTNGNRDGETDSQIDKQMLMVTQKRHSDKQTDGQIDLQWQVNRQTDGQKLSNGKIGANGKT